MVKDRKREARRIVARRFREVGIYGGMRFRDITVDKLEKWEARITRKVSPSY